jgi:hypothetical protein
MLNPFRIFSENKKAKEELEIAVMSKTREKALKEFADERKILVDKYENEITRVQESNIQRIKDSEEEFKRTRKQLELDHTRDKNNALHDMKLEYEKHVYELKQEILKGRNKLKIQADKYSTELAEKNQIIKQKNDDIQSAQDGFVLYRQHVINVYEKSMQFKTYVQTVFKDVLGNAFQKSSEFLDFFSEEVRWLEKNANKIEDKLRPSMEKTIGEIHYEVTKDSNV